ncbi:hypothetical protein [Aeromonas hydrophila]|uniref:hypothetical protein n=1 Tax=Aeromonas hydrophila TaxID=644 RepID=UPI002B471933|nr:hypothetical protein [Aeromonas hydrophila]
MGEYAKGLSKRLTCERFKEGYCLICDEHKSLTEDHVPPKSAITITRTEQKLISESFNSTPTKIKGVISKNGNKFKTLCARCNNSLADGDSEIGIVYKKLTDAIRTYFKNANGVSSIVSVEVDAKKYIKAMLGHILAATSEDECQQEQQSSPYFDPIKNFVLGRSESIDDSHDIYYWFYPKRMHLSAKLLAFHNKGNTCALSLLSFFPIAFLVTEKGKGIFPAHAMKFDSTCESLILDLSFRNINYSDFPFTTLEDDQFYLMQDYTCTISYPIK